MLRVQTSFQDTPGDGYFFVLYHNDRPLQEQLNDLGLKDGDTVFLCDPECGDYTIEATLLFDYRHPMSPEPGLWARANKNSN
ncbi:hypothetical protein FRZ61_06560 [Hypericibacter adhaerens]|jgi:hypothetical protein|uniref:Uncharacterized protein n=1 Tax=Hypericibacter adhaerens TaxID=2602016 RepID=A0A5J6MU96_9PROT|nr:hypothetical protein FRZ61_06560 [Hypericibacter adhaerens]